MWLAGSEVRLRPVLIEVGSSVDVWLAEVAKWRAWFGCLKNRISFCADFGIPHGYKNLNPEFLLIGGHGGGSVCADDARVTTLDEMKPDRESAGYICATKASARYQAVSVSPMMRLGPRSAVWLSRIGGLAEAVARNEWISPERRQFLMDRLPFWKRWPMAPKRLTEQVSWDDWE
jgi:hypothetical protein